MINEQFHNVSTVDFKRNPDKKRALLLVLDNYQREVAQSVC